MPRSTRTIALAIAGLLLAAIGPLGPLETAPAQAASAKAKYQKAAFKTTNKQRAKHDLRKLRKQKCIQRFAVRQAKRMANQERLYHQKLRPIMRKCGLNLAGENVAYGYPTGRSVVNQGWMKSEGHRANILNGDYRLMGIGARKSDDGTWYVAQVFGRKA